MITPTLALLLVTFPGPPQKGLARLEMAPVEIRLAGGGTRTAYRGMLHVPIVRANPESKEIGVDVWRFPADEGVPEGRPPLFRLFGGPGWPGLEPGDVDCASRTCASSRSRAAPTARSARRSPTTPRSETR